MTTFYLDFEGGNDANDGTTFANRWKTLGSGATAARIAPGDTIRVMASKDPTLVGSCSWTDKSATVTLPSAVTQDIENCEAAWTASANVTATTNTSRKQGSNSVNLAIAAGFTTGKVAYKALGAALNLSTYQQVAFWFYTNVAVASGAMRLALCSDANGDTPVANIAIPQVLSGAVNTWAPITVDTLAALPASVNSVALYCDSDPGTATVRLDHIIACKASSAADSLTLNSLLGKAHTQHWAASTAYSLGDIRRPTQANRTGYAYKVTTAGTTSGSEPTWPTARGLTVTDGSVVWECFQLEETFWPIMNISGTTVTLDKGANTTPATTGGGYSGTTETVASYKREPIVRTVGDSDAAVEDGAFDGGNFTLSCGWNRTDMSTLTGETWLDFGAKGSTAAGLSPVQDRWELFRLNVVRAGGGFSLADRSSLTFCHSNGGYYGVGTANTYSRTTLHGCVFAANALNGVNLSTYKQHLELVRCAVVSGGSSGVAGASNANYGKSFSATACDFKNNTGYGVDFGDVYHAATMRDVRTSDNSLGAFSALRAVVRCFDCLFSEGVPEPATTFGASGGQEFRYQNMQKTIGSHALYTEYGKIESATDQRNTASGYSVKASIAARFEEDPVRFSLGKYLCQSGVTKTFSAVMRRGATNVSARLIIPEASLRGISADAKTSDFAGAVDTWVSSGSLSITPTETGVVELFAEVWNTAGSGTVVLWIDDLTVT